MFKISKKLIFEKSSDRLKQESIINVINSFKSKKNNNLFFLLEQRFQWMQKYIRDADIGLEVGAGAGFSKYFLKCKKLFTSDCTNDIHLDFKNIDAQKTNFENESFDFIIASNMLHHTAHPVLFLREMHRILKKRGKLIIFEPYVSLMYQIITYLTKHEGYDFTKNIWDEKLPLNNENDPWDANDAISHLLFDKKIEFQKQTNNIFEIIYEDFSEFLIFINSGGVYSKSFYIPLNLYILKIVKCIDKFLIKIFPKIFALGRKIVLIKN